VIILFGYVKPQKSELLVREFEAYRGVYCALCRRLGKDYGFPTRLVLNYDCTFFAVVQLAVAESTEPDFYRGRCVVNPLKKCGFCRENGQELASAAALTVILAYYKVKDNVADSGFFRKLLSLAVLPFFKWKNRKAAKKYPELEKIVESAMKDQSQAEHDGCGIDRAAEPTAKMLAGVFESVGEGGSLGRVLHEAGYYLGRWIYLMDAADDLQRDLKKKNFNPFAVHFRLTAESTQEELKQARDFANEELNSTLARLTAAIELLKMNSLGPVVRNVVSNGLPMMQKELLYKKESGNVRSI
jgi:hypothetical protein